MIDERPLLKETITRNKEGKRAKDGICEALDCRHDWQTIQIHPTRKVVTDGKAFPLRVHVCWKHTAQLFPGNKVYNNR